MRRRHRQLTGWRGAGIILAGLLAVAFLLCSIHGSGGEGDGHALTHAACAPLVALMAVAVLLPLRGGTGWLLASVSLTVVAASLHLPDPPPKRLARS